MSAIGLSSPTPHIVIFGRDQAGKPHASWFDQASAELATKAAALMNMRAVPVEGDALRELVGTLPRGRVFASGRAFTPFVKGKLYGQLVELTRELLGLSASETGESEGENGGEPPANPGETPGQPGTLPGVEGSAGKAKSKSAPKQASDQPASPAPEGSDGGATDSKPETPAKPNPRPTRIEEVGMGSIVLAITGPTEGWFEVEVIGINGGMLTLRWCDYMEPTVVRRPHELGFLPALRG